MQIFTRRTRTITGGLAAAAAAMLALPGAGGAQPDAVTAGKKKLCCKVSYQGKTVVVTGQLKLRRGAEFLYAPGCKSRVGRNRVFVSLKRSRSGFERGYHRIDYVYRLRGKVRYAQSPRFFVRGTAKPPREEQPERQPSPAPEPPQDAPQPESSPAPEPETVDPPREEQPAG